MDWTCHYSLKIFSRRERRNRDFLHEVVGASNFKVYLNLKNVLFLEKEINSLEKNVWDGSPR
jgi:hypothetical protein